MPYPVDVAAEQSEMSPMPGKLTTQTTRGGETAGEETEEGKARMLCGC